MSTPRCAALAVVALLLPGCVAGSGVAKTESRPVSDFSGIHTSDVIDVVVRDGARTSGIELTCDDNLLDSILTQVDSDGNLHVRFAPGIAAMPRARCELRTGNTQLYEVISTGSGDVSIAGPAWSLDHIRTTGSGDVSVHLQEGGLQEAEDTQALVDDDTEDTLLQDEDGTQTDEIERLPAASRLEIETTGSGDVRVTGLDLNKVFVLTTGSGDLRLDGHASVLDARSTGSGDVSAKPLRVDRVDLNTTGSGDMTAWARTRATVRSTGSGDVTVYGDPDQRNRTSTGSGDIRFR